MLCPEFGYSHLPPWDQQTVGVSAQEMLWCRPIWNPVGPLDSTLVTFFFFFSFVRWKLQSPQWRWQCIAGPSGFRRVCGLRECGLARFPFWVAHRWGRTAVDVLLSDCQYRKGTVLYGQCGVWNIGDSWGGCGLSWAWTLSPVPVWLTGSRGQPCCTVGACASTCCVVWPWGWSSPQGSWWTYPLAPLLCLPLLESQQPHCQAHCSGMESIAGRLHGLYKVKQEQQTGR